MNDVTHYARIILDTTRTQDERIQAAFKLENIATDDAYLALSKALLED